MSSRYARREDRWERIRDLLPGRAGHVGGAARDNRVFVEAVLYRSVSRGDSLAGFTRPVWGLSRAPYPA